MTRALDAARESGLIEAGRPLLVMLSGGADSVCLVDAAVDLGAEVAALHVNYGLRESSDADEEHCRALCSQLGVALAVEGVELDADRPGNLQSAARELRYALAERHAGRGDFAAAHTASDQAETVLYRLAASPGRRALLGMEPRRGRLVRPLLGATRDDTHAHCMERGLPWREDPTNRDPRFARSRVRHELLEALRSVAPAAEATIVETSAQLREESEVLDALVEEAIGRVAAGGAVPLADLEAEPPGLRRLVLRRLAERAAGGEVALPRERVDELLSMGGRGGTSALDLGGGLRAVAEYGVLRFSRQHEPRALDPVALPVPGSVRFGDWEVSARADGGGEATVSAERLGPSATVRSWREGDRVRPAGLGGSKSLQDLFTDRKVPRELRRTLPVVEAGGEIAWVAGTVTDERFAAEPGPGTVGLSARRAT